MKRSLSVAAVLILVIALCLSVYSMFAITSIGRRVENVSSRVERLAGQGVASEVVALESRISALEDREMNLQRRTDLMESCLREAKVVMDSLRARGYVSLDAWADLYGDGWAGGNVSLPVKPSTLFSAPCQKFFK